MDDFDDDTFDNAAFSTGVPGGDTPPANFGAVFGFGLHMREHQRRRKEEEDTIVIGDKL
jgi:hypothetical protein